MDFKWNIFHYNGFLMDSVFTKKKIDYNDNIIDFVV